MSSHRRTVLRFITAIAIFTALGPGAATLQGQAISQVLFLPQTYYVGDIVEARVVVRTAESLDLQAPQDLPDTSWITVRSVTILQRTDGFEVRIVFQPFFLGTRELPTINLGGMRITGVSAFVSSVVEPGTDLQPESVRDQLLLPGTQLQIALGVLILLGVPFIIILAGGWGGKWLTIVKRRYHERRPYRRLARALKTLQGEITHLDGKIFYITLTDITRDFLDGRFHIGVRSATTGEMDHILRRINIPEEERVRLVALFQFGDLVKFANRKVTIAERTTHLEEIRVILELLQKSGLSPWEPQEKKGRHVDT